jgi:putative holliday junction resolvase
VWGGKIARAATQVLRRSRYTGSVKGNPEKSGVLAGERGAAAFKILALDYGRTKIGLALADSEARIAQPYDTLERINRNEDMRRLRELVNELRVRQIVVGLPLRLDGSSGEMAEEATRFAQRARKQAGVPVEMVDERLTSWEAERILEEEMGRRITREDEPAHGRKKSARATDGKYTVDAIAAMVILREYLARTALTKESR